MADPAALASFSRERLIAQAALTPADLEQVEQRRRDYNRLGFAYQIAFVRLTNRFPAQHPFEVVDELLAFTGAQLGIDPDPRKIDWARRSVGKLGNTRFDVMTVDRLAGVGAISKDDAIAWSMTGPLARASGVKRDLRKDEPYLCFKDNWDGQGAEAVKFSVPIATDGDCLSRYLVRVEEIKQSCRIIDQLIDRIPGGPMDASPEGKMRIPPKGDVYGSIEATIQQFEIFMTNRGWDVPIGETYAAIESPNGELGYYIVGDGTKCAWRAKTRPPSFIHFQALPKLL